MQDHNTVAYKEEEERACTTGSVTFEDAANALERLFNKQTPEEKLARKNKVFENLRKTFARPEKFIKPTNMLKTFGKFR